MNNIKLFLVRNYGSTLSAAETLDVTPNTVRNWCGRSPRNILKHLPEISQTCGATYAEIVEEVLLCEKDGIQ